MTPLVVENVVKTFRQGDAVITALGGVSLEVRQGAFLAVMGASGSGKSTLLHVMAGLTRPDSGRVLIDGRNIAEMSNRHRTILRRRRIGLVFQAFNLIPTLSARQNIALPLMLDGADRQAIADRVSRILAMLQLEHRADHRPDALSGGEQQRVAIGRALVADPAILLADEPTGNLDSVSSRSVCELLRDLCLKHGRTIVMVTHEPSVAIYAREVAVMKDGKIVARFSSTECGDGQTLAVRYHECVR